MTRHTTAGIRYFIRCPVEARVEVEPGVMQTWRINVGKIAKVIRHNMDLSGTLRNRVPDRLWSMGRTRWHDRSREVMLVRGLGDTNVDPVIHCVGGGQAIVLVPHHVPDAHVWPGRVPAIVPLSQVTTIEEHALTLDTLAMAEIVDEADQAAHVIGGLTLTERELNAVIRRNIKAVNKATLTDEAIVAAYRLHGGTRPTEEALRQAGYSVDHSTIARKVKEAEEADELRETRDSGSVGRSVASQTRDRGKKISQYRK